MICQRCGRNVEPGKAFCPYCGNKMEPQRPKKSGRNALVITIVVVLALVAVILIFDPFNMGIRNGKAADPVTVSAPAEDSSSETEDSSALPDEDADAASEADEQLLSYADQAHELAAQTLEDYDAIQADENSTEEIFKARGDIFAEAADKLTTLQEEASEYANDDPVLAEAIREYIQIYLSVYTSNAESYDLLYRFLSDLNANYLALRPSADSYSDTDAFMQDYLDWYEASQSACEAFEHPAYMDDMWEDLMDKVDLNQYAYTKYCYAYYYSDPLRLRSAQELAERYEAAYNNWYDGFLDELKFSITNAFQSGQTKAEALYEEIGSYSTLSDTAKSEYTFDTLITDQVLFTVNNEETIYPSLYSSYASFANIYLSTFDGSSKVTIEAEIPGFTQQFKQTYTITNSTINIQIKPPLLTGDMDLSSAKDAQLNLTITNETTGSVVEKSYPITLKSKNDVEFTEDEFGYSNQDNMLCFLTPESTAITQLKRTAIDEIYELTDGEKESFTGYQQLCDTNYATTYLQAAGLMKAMYDSGVRYNMDPFSVSGSTQHILYPEEVLESDSGLCIETSLTIASALQSAGMHAFILFPSGHAQVAVEAWGTEGGTGYGQYFLIETTALTEDSNDASVYQAYLEMLEQGTYSYDADSPYANGPITFMSNSDWEDYLDSVLYVLDCDDSQILGLTPLSN